MQYHFPRPFFGAFRHPGRKIIPPGFFSYRHPVDLRQHLRVSDLLHRLVVQEKNLCYRTFFNRNAATFDILIGRSKGINRDADNRELMNQLHGLLVIVMVLLIAAAGAGCISPPKDTSPGSGGTGSTIGGYQPGNGSTTGPGQTGTKTLQPAETDPQTHPDPVHSSR